MKDARGVLLAATARVLEPLDRQRFAAGFLARHEASRGLGDGLVHAFSPTHERLRRAVETPEGVERTRIEDRHGWAPYCVSGLSHNELPGYPCLLENVTCVACIAGLVR